MILPKQHNSSLVCEVNRVKTNVRDEIDNILPLWMRFAITEVTGKAATNEKSIWLKNGWECVWVAYASLVGGVLFNIWIVENLNFLTASLLPIGWLATTSGARMLQVGIGHACAHVNCTGNAKVDCILGEISTILVWIRAFVSYASDHRFHHSLKQHLTDQDETVRFLYHWVGLRPGCSISRNKRRLFSSIISPLFHLKVFLGRIKACFGSSSLAHNAAALLIWGLIFMGVDLLGMWEDFFVAWMFPVVILYQISATLRLTLEHIWPDSMIMSRRDRLFVCRATANVFCGELPPIKTGFVFKDRLAMVVWCMRMFFIHFLFGRLFILVGDTPTHALHHRVPNSDWCNAPYVYQKEIQLGHHHGPEPYIEIWGVMMAIDASLESLANQLPSKVRGSVY